MFPVVNHCSLRAYPAAERSECQCHWQPESGAVTAPDRPTTMDAAHAVQLVKERRRSNAKSQMEWLQRKERAASGVAQATTPDVSA